ncbi:Fic family protein [Vallitalea pronyensis]|uniref:Fic family protein n=1 Tax=Vallitalea pronyensis TaxID=1348613 RepID=A0A8J8MHQ4_9FIRM|nr:Fic family protein [Vallitalea pronyensis]QUI21814.1 Fic family protein [Vallitalea pronyensis]
MNFKQYLEERGIGLSDLSKACDIPYTTLYNGVEKPSSIRSENLKKIANYFNVSMDEVYKMLGDVQEKTLLSVLQEQKTSKLKGNLYHITQILFAYNTNRIEGSQLSEEDTRYIFETNTLINQQSSANVDDIVETANHFYLFDKMIDQAQDLLTENMIKKYHEILKNGTSDARLDWFNVGEYKALPNEVGGKETTLPKDVAKDMKKLLHWYNGLAHVEIDAILEFHYQFETIHPFQDGNGRIGRIIMFKECLKHAIIPFIIEDEYKAYYYRGLSEYKNEKGFLVDTCLMMQDRYREMVWKFLGDVIVP